MKSFSKKELCSGAKVVFVPASRFKTNDISINFTLPLRAETASNYAIVPFLISRSCAKYPKASELSNVLAGLYGASVSANVRKIGENQSLTLDLTCLDDRFSLDGESISYKCLELLFELAFRPRVENNAFFTEDVEREKALLIQALYGEENEKRIYAQTQLEKHMFKNEPYGVHRFGTAKQIEAITENDAYNAWSKMLEKAKIQITVVGSADEDKVLSLAKKELSSIKRSYEGLPEAAFVSKASDVNTVVERQKIKQGKLVLGFRVDIKPESELTPAMKSTADIFGGGPYSKLFANVREKMSLCYYCSARYNKAKSIMLVQCGCEEENMDKALYEILNQLEQIKLGNFDNEFNSSKIAISDMINSVSDSPDMLKNWYSVQIVSSEIKSPELSVEENEAVTKEDVIECAKRITLDTVYKLCSEKEAE